MKKLYQHLRNRKNDPAMQAIVRALIHLFAYRFDRAIEFLVEWSQRLGEPA